MTEELVTLLWFCSTYFRFLSNQLVIFAYMCLTNRVVLIVGAVIWQQTLVKLAVLCKFNYNLFIST